MANEICCRGGYCCQYRADNIATLEAHDNVMPLRYP